MGIFPIEYYCLIHKTDFTSLWRGWKMHFQCIFVRSGKEILTNPHDLHCNWMKTGTFRNQWQSLYSFRIICRGLGLDVLLPNLPTCHLVESFAWVDFKRSQATCGSPVKRASIIALPASLCFITDIFSELFIGPMCTWSPIIWSPCVSLCLSLWEVFET